MLDRVDDTIVAISSAPGRGLRGIVRLSGPGTRRIARAIMVRADGDSPSIDRGFARIDAEFALDDKHTLPASFYVFCAPRSYTRQDMLEIHTIGSPVVLEMVRQRAIALGAIPAQPGEFTARAFVNGAMDLSRAEAVAVAIGAQTDTQLRAARCLMDGGLAEQMSAVRGALAELTALIEADIDFAEEPIEFITPRELQNRLGDIGEQLQAMVNSLGSIERLDDLPRILLLGPPNAGKSTLMNRLSGTDRSICAAVAGTTRDILSAPVQLAGVDAILLDSAGVDQSEDELIANARSMVLSTAERVDVICLVVDVATKSDEPFARLVRSLDLPAVVIAANKSDLQTPDELARSIAALSARFGSVAGQGLAPIPPDAPIESAPQEPKVCAVSALTGDGIEPLANALASLLSASPTTTSGESIVLSERQRTAICAAREAVARAMRLAGEAKETIDRADLLAFELRDALDFIGAVTGEVTTEDLLSEVFASFCIGK